MTPPPSDNERDPSQHFIRAIIEADVASGKNGGRVHTRFPPEPSGQLHIGHAKAICLSYAMAEAFGGKFNLRFDDTNPSKEETEYVEGIMEDIRWLGCDWEDRLYFASDYFDDLYGFAVQLIERGKAFVCDLTADEVREHRGTITTPGRNSPFRDRSVEESLNLFRGMRTGEFPDGARTLRAKIDMASPNLNLRDPVMYRISRVPHHRTGTEWCIYPMYDWAHGQSDAIEGITHSLCSLEFENHRPLYDWFLDNFDAPCHPQQIEFARLALTYTVMSKRKLIRLVQEGHVTGWDDPRMSTLSGLRRRGYTASAIRTFQERIGMTKVASTIGLHVLENCLREELNKSAPRRMAVLRPLKIVITNFPEGETEDIEAVNNPEDEAAGTRTVPLTREIWIEQTDFRMEAPRRYHRLAPNREVRLRYAYCITCNQVIQDPDTGEVTELRCTYDPETAHGKTPDGRKVKGIVHWVSAAHAVDAKVRLYDNLFDKENPEDVGEGGDFTDHVNPNSLEVLSDAKLEPSLAAATLGERFQFERHGYFCADSADHRPDNLVFNRTVSLRDSWAKLDKKR